MRLQRHIDELLPQLAQGPTTITIVVVKRLPEAHLGTDWGGAVWGKTVLGAASSSTKTRLLRLFHLR